MNAVYIMAARKTIDRSKVFFTFCVTVMRLHEPSCTVLPYRIYYAMGNYISYFRTVQVFVEECFYPATVKRFSIVASHTATPGSLFNNVILYFL